MGRKFPALMVVGILTIAGTPAVQGQTSSLPPAPVPITPASPPQGGQASPAGQPPPASSPAQPTLPPPALLPPPPPLPPSAVPPPYAPYAPYQDNNGPLLRGDPLIDRPGSPPPGWFFAFELDLVGPHIKNRLQAPVTVDGFFPDIVHLPTAELDWTGAPRFELGYRLPEGLGEFLVTYRFLDTQGTANLPGFDLDGNDAFLKSRLSMNVLDIDYASREYSLAPRWDMKWRVGARLADIFFDSRAEGNFIEEHTSNLFYGGGAHVGLDLWRRLDAPGLALFMSVDGASVVGQIRQSFEEVFVTEARHDADVVGGATEVHHTQASPVFTFRGGVDWTPCWYGRWTHYSLGYEFERWWDLGNAAGSKAELTTQGIFFRGEWRF